MTNAASTVDGYMARDLVTFSPEDDILAAVNVLLDERISGAPVVDGSGHLVGVLSKKDCLGVVYSTSYHQEWGGRVEEYMSRDVETMDAGTDIIKAADMFMNSSYRRFPVLANGRLVGQISRTDILRALKTRWTDQGSARRRPRLGRRGRT